MQRATHPPRRLHEASPLVGPVGLVVDGQRPRHHAASRPQRADHGPAVAHVRAHEAVPVHHHNDGRAAADGRVDPRHPRYLGGDESPVRDLEGLPQRLVRLLGEERAAQHLVRQVDPACGAAGKGRRTDTDEPSCRAKAQAGVRARTRIAERAGRPLQVTLLQLSLRPNLQ